MISQTRTSAGKTGRPAADKGTTSSQYLTFWLGSEVFGMDIRTVREIIQAGPMTALPLMPDFVRGVINLRGSVVPVVDLNARFGRAPSVLSKKSCVIVFDAVRQGERVELGLLVDAVNKVLRIPADEIESPPDFGASIRRDFIQGVGKVGDRFVVLLEPDRALDMHEMSALCDRTHELALCRA